MWAVATVLVAAGVVTAVVVSQSGSDGSAPNGRSSLDAGSKPVTDRPTACAIEVGVVLVLSYVGSPSGGGTDTGVFQIVETDDDVAQVVFNGLLSDFQTTANYDGVSTAEAKIAPKIRNGCSVAANPILTQDQVQELSQIASPDDADALGRVSVFKT